MKQIKRVLEIYRGYFRITIVRYLAYRVELVIWLTSMILQPVVFMCVWRAATHTGETINGYSRADIATYFILVMLINHATMAWVMWEWDGRVRNGELSYLLLRPHHVFHRDVGENISFKTATLPVMLLTAFFLVLTTKPSIHVTALHVIAFVPAMLFAYALRFTVDWVTALGSFFTTRVDALNVFYFFMLLLFSGQMAPLPFLPTSLRIIATFLPFRWMLDFPVRLMMGRLTPHEIVTGLFMQALWVGIAGTICSLVWRKGVRGYTAVGI
jgi:ABC-2 type transport system permease protein